jgi:hypothetical protein
MTSVSFASIVKRGNLLLPILRPHINIQKIRKKPNKIKIQKKNTKQIEKNLKNILVERT